MLYYDFLVKYVPQISQAVYRMADIWKNFSKIKKFDTTGITGVADEEGSKTEAIYDLDGRRIDAPQKGINIIRMSDGTTRKVLVK